MDATALAVIAALLIAYAAVSARLQTTVVTQAMVFVTVGLLVGTRGLDVVHADVANQVLRHLAEATLTLLLFTDAVRINLQRLRRELQVPTRLLGVGLPLTIVVGAVVGLAVFPQLDLWTAAILATILAPTDAALGLPVVNNRRLPSRIRQGLNVESGLNDGVCVPLLIIFVIVAEAEEGTEVEPLRVVAEEIGFGIVGGLVAGLVGAWVLREFAARRWMDRTWKQINGVATPALAYAVASALGGSGFIAAFVAGVTFGVVASDRAESTTMLAEQNGELLNAVTFLMFGAVLLGPALAELDWRIVLYASLSLTVARMLPVAVAMLGTRMRRVTVAFIGWFGPRGLASIVFVLIIVEQSELTHRSLIMTVVACTVALSVYAHGFTAWPSSSRYADWYAAHTTDHAVMPESAPAVEHRTRASTVTWPRPDQTDVVDAPTRATSP
jgi:NhaP-type Na+/H+ or K+/H+ antiporter